ncbi:tellurite resistance TerB C-terminal domain-containing protein [Pollutibacter soli]|uniref:tellurite resistance TerB C-terminal domain-containing protein n=1 Tax=Pollutibacter soli TaxID=3034157 RepID=UPI0030132D12
MKSKAKILFTIIVLILSFVGKAQTNYKVNTDAKLRSGPGAKYRTIIIIKNGENVRHVEQTNSNWIKIDYNGKIGFISSKLISTLPDTVSLAPNPIPQTTSKTKEDRTPYYILIVIVVVLIILSLLKKKEPAQGSVLKITAERNNNSQSEKIELLVDKVKKNSKTGVQINIETPLKTNVRDLDKTENRNSIFRKLQPGKVPEDINTLNAAGTGTNQHGIDEALNETTPDYSKTGDDKNDTIKNIEDETIIDVSDQNYNLSVFDREAPGNVNVPHWNHQYVYSASEISNATEEQKQFYNYFKQQFLKGNYLDLHGNTNYCFILLFDMIDAFKQHKSLALIENQIAEIGQHYPVTSRYGISALLDKLEAVGDHYSLQRLRSRHNLSIQSLQQTPSPNYSFDPDCLRLGAKFQSSLSLTANEVEILNSFWSPTNNFFSIDHCGNTVVKLFVAVIRLLDEKLKKAQSSLQTEITTVVDIALRKHFHYNPNSYNYTSSINYVKAEIYSNALKLCENVVRERYGHKRKLNTDTFITTPEAKEELDSRVFQKVNTALIELIETIEEPDEVTELELNAQNTGRWKPKFEELCEKFSGKSKEFTALVLSLGSQNSRNPAIENLFFEASKFLAKIDKESSLLMFIHYIHHDLNSSNFDNRKLTKTVQKSLFSNNEQLRSFEKLLSDLINDRNLQAALEAVPTIYENKRKKIQLNSEHIREVRELHSDTVELLNEYLKDEYEDESTTIKTEQISNNEIKIDILPKNATAHSSVFLADLRFSEVQIELLLIFSKNNFSIFQSDVEAFAKSKSVFKNHLIEGINEICYECLDDILIEEVEESVSINPEYYKRLLK